MKKKLGLLFDMDGVIVNNHEYHFLAWQKLAEKHKIEITEEFYRKKMNGRTFNGIMEVLFDGTIAEEKARDIGTEKEQIYRELYKPHLAPTAGLISFLDEMKARNIPMAIGTSAPVENVVFTLDGLNIRDYFAGVVDDKAVTQGKPHPEVYLKCAELLQIPPKDCIVFEDAVSGITAGKAAGAKTVALATSHKKEELQADMIIDDFTQLRLDDLLKLAKP
ncbi:MAG: HAD family phosphatase [Bacteroidota bacterium]